MNDEQDEMKIWFKNEHLASWLNAEPHIASLDQITFVTREKAQLLFNLNIKKGQGAAVLVFKTDDKWRTEKGLKVLRPRYFGYGFEYKSVDIV